MDNFYPTNSCKRPPEKADESPRNRESTYSEPQVIFRQLLSRGSSTFSVAVLLVQVTDRIETSQTTSGMSYYLTPESAFYAVVWS